MNYTLGDFEGISYSHGDFVAPGTSGFSGIVDSAKTFIADNQVGLLAVAILGLGIMALGNNKRA